MTLDENGGKFPIEISVVSREACAKLWGEERAVVFVNPVIR